MSRSLVDIKPVAKIGRPPLGGEYFHIVYAPHGQYEIKRVKKVNSSREEYRQCDVWPLPGAAMVFDLLSAIEDIYKDADMQGRTINLDDTGIDGQQPTLRQRLQALVEKPNV